MVRMRCVAAIVASALLLAGCASGELAREPYTASEAALAEIPGMPNVRFYADSGTSVFDSFSVRSAGGAFKVRPISYLALSGGGADGAFGVGFLHGLSETGRRPDFTIVSGVSTGALMAPMVFLGPSYDTTLHEVYGTALASSLVKNINPINALIGNSLVESDKLGHFVRKYITADIVAQVAAEHRKGRRLFVATTNLDSQRAVVWDMGAIANSGSPNAVSLFQQVLTASASIPGLFPPRLIDVEANGREFKEMHVDGSTIQQIFVAPDDVLFGNARDNELPAFKDLYILLNNKYDPVFEVVPNETIQVGTRSLSTVLKHETRNNVLASYAYAHRHGVGFHLAAIDADVSEVGSTTFDPAYMEGLYAYGESEGRSGHPWADRPTVAQPIAADTKVAAGIKSGGLTDLARQ